MISPYKQSTYSNNARHHNSYLLINNELEPTQRGGSVRLDAEGGKAGARGSSVDNGNRNGNKS